MRLIRRRPPADSRLDPHRGATAEITVDDGHVVGCLMSVVLEVYSGSLWWKDRREAVEVLFDLADLPARRLSLMYDADEWLDVAACRLLDLDFGTGRRARLRRLHGTEHDEAVARMTALHDV